MKLQFCSTLGQQLFYIWDGPDSEGGDEAILLKLEFCGDGFGLTYEQKTQVAQRALEVAMGLIGEYVEENSTPPELPSKPLSEASVGVVNSILNCHVDESKILRDYDEGI